MADAPKKIDALIIDPDAESRMRLKQASSAFATFGKVIPVSTLSDARERIESQGTYIIIFLASSFLNEEKSKQALLKFVAEMKQSPNGQDSAYVMVLRAEHQKNSTLALGTLSGIDSFLAEPFSVDSLVETTALAHSVYRQRKDGREEKMIEFLVNDVLRSLDSYVLNIKLGNPPGSGLRAMREGMQAIASLEPHIQGLYFNILTYLTERASPMSQTISTGASKRAIERLRRRFAEQGQKSDVLNPPAAPKSSGGPRIIIRK